MRQPDRCQPRVAVLVVHDESAESVLSKGTFGEGHKHRRIDAWNIEYHASIFDEMQIIFVVVSRKVKEAFCTADL